MNSLDQEHEILDTGGSPNSPQAPFRAGWHYKDGFPRGGIMVEITRITLRRQGPWSIEWTPPITPAALTAQAAVSSHQHAACQVEEPPAALYDLPAGLGGRVAYSKFNGEQHGLFISNLESMQVTALRRSRSFEVGQLPPGVINVNLSPDGKRLLYTTERELFLVTLSDMSQRLLITKTTNFGNQIHPLWSPDGQWIAMTYWESADSAKPKLALLQPDTCQIVFIPGQEAGWLSSWVTEEE